MAKLVPTVADELMGSHLIYYEQHATRGGPGYGNEQKNSVTQIPQTPPTWFELGHEHASL